MNSINYLCVSTCYIATRSRYMPCGYNTCQGLSQEGKKFYNELGNKMQLGVWVHCEPLNGFSGDQGKNPFMASFPPPGRWGEE